MESWRNFQKIHKTNEKIYKQYAERLSDEMQKTFWDLPEDGKVFIIEETTVLTSPTIAKSTFTFLFIDEGSISI